MKYIKAFNTQYDKSDFKKNSEKYITPNIYYIRNIGIVESEPYDPSLTFIALEDGSTISLNANGSAPSISLQYSLTNGESWISYTIGNTITIDNAGNKVKFRAVSTNAKISSSTSNYYNFVMSSGKFEVCGDITSLLNVNGGNISLPTYNFFKLFMSCANLIRADQLKLPSTTLGTYCYRSLFEGCTNLETIPSLSAVTLNTGCYYRMFRDCESITSSPILFSPALVSNCYYHMFYGCSNLSKITCLAINISASGALTGWTTNVSSTGTFYKRAANTSWPTGTAGIPTGWTVVDFD